MNEYTIGAHVQYGHGYLSYLANDDPDALQRKRSALGTIKGLTTIPGLVIVTFVGWWPDGGDLYQVVHTDNLDILNEEDYQDRLADLVSERTS